MGGINLAQDMEEWQAVGNIVINFWIPQDMGKFLKSWSLISFPDKDSAALRYLLTLAACDQYDSNPILNSD